MVCLRIFKSTYKYIYSYKCRRIYTRKWKQFFFLSSFRTGDLARKIIQITRIDELLGRSERSEFQFRSSNSVYQLYLFSRMDSTHHSFWTATNQNTISPHFYTFRQKVTNYLFSLDQFCHRYYSLLHFLHHEKYYIARDFFFKSV